MSIPELDSLRQAFPHRRWHHAMIIIALVITAIPIARALEFPDPSLLQPLAIAALILYWMLQFRLMQSGVHLSRGGHSTSKIVRAVLRHHRRYVIAAVVMMLSVSLALTVFLFYRSSLNEMILAGDYGRFSRGILKYVGTVSSGYGWIPYDFPRGTQWMFIAFAAVMMMDFTLANSFLSISIGLWAGRLRRAVMGRIVLFVIVSVIFTGLYALRETPEWTCHRNSMIPSQCSDMLFRMRVVDSIQGMILTYIDGGMAVLTGLFCPPRWWVVHSEPYQVRHFAVALVTLASQLALSALLLRNTRNRAPL